MHSEFKGTGGSSSGVRVADVMDQLCLNRNFNTKPNRNKDQEMM